MSIMRNSRVPDAWVAEAIRANPFSRIIDSATGNPTGSLTTCPCRLSYPSLFAPEKNRQTGQPTKYKATLLFPPGVDMGLLVQEYHAAVQRLFPGIPANQDGSYPGLHPPFKDQGAKSNSPGYTPGAWAITVSTQYKPHICDPALNPITDESRVYPGVWAIVACNFYKFGVSPPQPKKGVGIGMQTVMIIADDRVDRQRRARPGESLREDPDPGELQCRRSLRGARHGAHRTTARRGLRRATRQHAVIGWPTGLSDLRAAARRRCQCELAPMTHLPQNNMSIVLIAVIDQIMLTYPPAKGAEIMREIIDVLVERVEGLETERGGGD